MIVLGIDPGLERTGYAFFEKGDDEPRALEYGCILTERSDRREVRFARIYNQLKGLIKKHAPHVMVLEELFYNINVKTAITVAQAQGVILLLAAQHHMVLEFLTPKQVKQIVTGYGHADKQSVQKMLKLLLGLDDMPNSDDAADAMACALAYCSIKKFDTP